MRDDHLSLTSGKVSPSERCGKAGEWKRLGTVATIHTEALSGDPEDTHTKTGFMTDSNDYMNFESIMFLFKIYLKKDLSLNGFIHVQKGCEEANANH